MDISSTEVDLRAAEDEFKIAKDRAAAAESKFKTARCVWNKFQTVSSEFEDKNRATKVAKNKCRAAEDELKIAESQAMVAESKFKDTQAEAKATEVEFKTARSAYYKGIVHQSKYTDKYRIRSATRKTYKKAEDELKIAKSQAVAAESKFKSAQAEAKVVEAEFETIRSEYTDKYRTTEAVNKVAEEYKVAEAEFETAKNLLQLAENNYLQKTIDQIRRKFRDDFIGADLFYQNNPSSVFPESEYKKEKIKFVQEWVSQETSMYLDADQARAIGEIHGNIQLVARAGSGKTLTIINRALFLVKHCNINPEELLLLAFNKKAVLEMRRRLLFAQHRNAKTEFESQKGKALANPKKQKSTAKYQEQDFEENIIDDVAERLGIELPHVMTFHALAHAIVKPTETLVYDDPHNSIFALSGSLQEVIVKHIYGELEPEIRELMLTHFRNVDWEETTEEFLQFRRSLPCQTLNGERVKSEGEKIIADFLFEHDIKYKYKPWCKGIRRWQPDFTILKKRKCVIIQHLGLESDYEHQKKHNWEIIELFPHLLDEESPEDFKEMLKRALEEKEIKCVKLSEEEIWLRIKKRAIDRFTSATKSFVSRCRQLSWTPVELEKRTSKYLKTGNGDSRPSLVEKQFLKIVQRIYLDYLERLSITNEEDFNGLMQRAANKINAGHTEFVRRDSRCDLRTIRYMFIDEFQDFSELFYKLVSAIKKLNQEVELFCVGDDWQAINGFAGSDLIFFENFDRYFSNPKRLYMTTNYRSQQSIVKAGNILMSGLGKPAESSRTTEAILVAVADLDKFERSPVENFHDDPITPAVLRLAQQVLKGNQDVVLLSRVNNPIEHKKKDEEEINDETTRDVGIQDFEKLVRSYLPEELREKISASTVHKYKGLEKKIVVILDAVENCYPLIHPDWIFTKIFGDDLSKVILAEQRLFYVAITRAVNGLIIITRGAEKSPFLEKLISSKHIRLMWDKLPPLTYRGASDRYLVKVSNMKERGSDPTYNIKEELKESGYMWIDAKKYWWKFFSVENFNMKTVRSSRWARKANGVSVEIFDGTDTNCLASYVIESAGWKCEFNQLEASDPREDEICHHP